MDYPIVVGILWVLVILWYTVCLFVWFLDVYSTPSRVDDWWRRHRLWRSKR